MMRHLLLLCVWIVGCLWQSGCGGIVVELTDQGSTVQAGASSVGGVTATSTFSTGGGASTASAESSGGSPTATTAPSTNKPIPPCWDFAPGSTVDWRLVRAVAWLPQDSSQRDEVAAAMLLEETTFELYMGPGYGVVNPGALKLTIPFASTQSNYQGVRWKFVPDQALDLSHRIIKAYVRLVSGMNANNRENPSGAKLAVTSGPNDVYVDSRFVNLSQNEWIEVALDIDAPAYLDPDATAAFDPTDVRSVSFEIDTSGYTSQVLSPGIVYVDHICL